MELAFEPDDKPNISRPPVADGDGMDYGSYMGSDYSDSYAEYDSEGNEIWEGDSG